MKTVLVIAFAAGLAGATEHPEHPKGAAPAVQEHPQGQAPAAKEHPQQAKQEHPMVAKNEPPAAKKEHPKHEHPVGSKGWLKEMRKGYSDAVEQNVAASKDGFKVNDAKLAKDWNLKLLRVHKDRIVNLGGNSFFACADFKSLEKGAKDKLDLDFYATKNGDSWNIDKVLVHKVNGKERYTYNEKNEMVPVQE